MLGVERVVRSCSGNGWSVGTGNDSETDEER